MSIYTKELLQIHIKLQQYYDPASAGGVVVAWRENRFSCKDVVKEDCSISYLLECCGFQWVFTRVYCRGLREEISELWRELKGCKNKWGGKWVVGVTSIWC